MASHTFKVTSTNAGQMRELLKKHSGITWKESGWVVIDFVATGSQEAIDAFRREFAVAEDDWISREAW